MLYERKGDVTAVKAEMQYKLNDRMCRKEDGNFLLSKRQTAFTPCVRRGNERMRGKETKDPFSFPSISP